MFRTRIKICGLTRSQDVRAAVDSGADAIGFVFYPPSPRAVSIEQAAELVALLPPFVVSVGLFGANPVTYMANTFQFMDWNDVSSGLVKSAVFGLLIAIVGCQKGFYTTGGAEGVGRSTTRAVVLASITILVSDFFLTKLLY